MSNALAKTSTVFHPGGVGIPTERYVTVLLVVTLHLFVIWQLSSRFLLPRPSHSTLGNETVVYLKPPRLQAELETRHVPAPDGKRTSAVRPRSSSTAPWQAPKLDLPATPPPVPAKIEEPDAHPDSGIAQHSLDSVGNVLKALRKEGAFPAVENAETKPSRFEKAIASAARPRETTMQTFRSSDGHMVTRVSGPHGTYCVEAALDSDADGIDHMQHGVGTKMVHCPF